MSVRLDNALEKIRTHALSYPEAWEDSPWGDIAFKVGKKAFVFAGKSDRQLSLSAKLPSSSFVALDLPFASPTGYGLGKTGWVTATFAPSDAVPISILKSWIDESYRAVAPKRLIKTL